MTHRYVLDALGCSLAGGEADDFLALVKGIKKLDAGMESPVWGTEIDQVSIRTFEKALLDQRILSNTMDAVYSIPFAAASYLIHGRLTPREISGDAFKDPRALNLYNRIHNGHIKSRD